MTKNHKRTIIIIVYAVIFFLTGWLLYYLIAPNPTCVDKKKNQGEGGIDCGGPCERKCEEPLHLQDLTVKTASFFYGGEGKYDVVVKIYNSNETHGASEFTYKMILKSNSGSVITAREGKDFILPMEDKYLIENNIDSISKPTKVEVKISNVEWKEFSNYLRPNFTYTKKFNLISSGPAYCEVFGNIFNETNSDFGLVRIKVILRDSNGNPIAANKTEIREFTAKSEREYRLIWPISFPGTVNEENIEVVGESNVFKEDRLVF